MLVEGAQYEHSGPAANVTQEVPNDVTRQDISSHEEVFTSSGHHVIQHTVDG